MWYNTTPSFVPIDPNMYFLYYYGIKGLDPLIFGIKERHIVGTIQLKLVPLVEQLEQTQYLVRVQISRPRRLVLVPNVYMFQKQW
jgi:hypothetical protein